LARRLLRVALTGGIATGKSYCAARLADLGAPLIDADVLAREAVAPGTSGLAAVEARFGRGVFNADGTLDRRALARIVFPDRTARADLEAIVHPFVYDRVRDWFTALSQRPGGPNVAVAIIPLLYETGRARDFDRVIVAVCPRALQIERLMARDRISDDEAGSRIDTQWHINEKALLADYVIDTSGTFEATDRQIAEVWRRLCDDAGEL
jgi:dephospho-CoA kinase